MKITSLLDNVSDRPELACEHGLSLYIEADGKKILFDMGHTRIFAENAEKLGVDLSAVDFAVVSHGHWDHGGGIPYFLELNPTAPVYLSRWGFDPYYDEKSGDYAGLDTALRENPRIVLTGDELTLTPHMFLCSCNGRERRDPFGSFGLSSRRGGVTQPDDFRHEQYLVIQEGNLQVLFSGCCHHGIRNVLAAYRKLYGRDPDDVISGFHLLQRKGYSDEDVEEIVDTAHALKEFNTVFYTGHCTGEKPYEVMKGIMGDQLQYMHCGDEIKLNMKKVTELKPVIAGKKGSGGMKLHKFFAWATVGCFVMTMVTGYKHK